MTEFRIYFFLIHIPPSPQEENIFRRFLVYAVVFSKRAPPTVAISFLKEDGRVIHFCPFRSKNSHQFTLQKRNYCLFSFFCSWQEGGCVVFYGERCLFHVGDYEILRWIAGFDMASLVNCVFPDGTLRRYSSWNMGKALFSVPQSSCDEWWHCLVLFFLFTSAGGKGRCFNLCRSRAHHKCMKWIKISYEGRE